jgi:hypothetical protein
VAVQDDALQVGQGLGYRLHQLPQGGPDLGVERRSVFAVGGGVAGVGGIEFLPVGVVPEQVRLGRGAGEGPVQAIEDPVEGNPRRPNGRQELAASRGEGDRFDRDAAAAPGKEGEQEPGGRPCLTAFPPLLRQEGSRLQARCVHVQGDAQGGLVVRRCRRTGPQPGPAHPETEAGHHPYPPHPPGLPIAPFPLSGLHRSWHGSTSSPV